MNRKSICTVCLGLAAPKARSKGARGKTETTGGWTLCVVAYTFFYLAEPDMRSEVFNSGVNFPREFYARTNRTQFSLKKMGRRTRPKKHRLRHDCTFCNLSRGAPYRTKIACVAGYRSHQTFSAGHGERNRVEAPCMCISENAKENNSWCARDPGFKKVLFTHVYQDSASSIYVGDNDAAAENIS